MTRNAGALQGVLGELLPLQKSWEVGLQWYQDFTLAIEKALNFLCYLCLPENRAVVLSLYVYLYTTIWKDIGKKKVILKILLEKYWK